MKRIILGSHGTLGQHLARHALAAYGPEAVVLSDYRAERLARLAQQLQTVGKVPETRLIDIRDEASLEAGLTGIDQVFIALQQPHPLVQRVCLSRGIMSFDLSVAPGFLAQARQLEAAADAPLQLLTAGLFPGLSGLLAKALSTGEAPVDIGLLQSTHGSNGPTGVADMLQLFDQPVDLLIGSHTPLRYPGFQLKRAFPFPGDWGSRSLRLCHFVERDYLAAAGIRANFWTAFDQPAFNALIGGLKRLGLLKLFGHPRWRRRLGSWFSQGTGRPRPEPIGLAAMGGQKQLALRLTGDYAATAACALAFAHKAATAPGGVRFPFECFTFAEIEAELEAVIEAKVTP